MQEQKTLHLPPLDHRLLAALATALCFTLYVRTLAPTALWYDMAEMAAGAYHLGILHHTGYPLYVLLGKLFTFLPVGDIAYRVNLMSATFAAGTVCLIFFVVWELTHSRPASLLSALILGASSTLWANATLAESYDLNAFLIALLSYLLLRWQTSRSPRTLVAAWVVLGLGMGNHHLIQFFAPGMLLYWFFVARGEHRWPPLKPLLHMALAFLGGFAVNLFMPIRAAMHTQFMWADASDPLTFLKMVTVGMQRGAALQSPLATLPRALLRLRVISLFPLYEFTPVGLGLALVGAIALWRQNRPLLAHTLAGAGLTLVMILIYAIHNIFQYFLPVYVMMAIWLGVGLAALIEWLRRFWETRVTPRGASVGATTIVLALTLALLILPIHLVSRDWDTLDRSQDYSSFDYAQYLGQRLEPNAIVLADFWAWAPLAYYQSIGGWRPDVELLGALSLPEVDWPSYWTELQKRDVPIYVAAGLRLPAELTELTHLEQVGINVIQTHTVAQVPKPQYKDVWLPLMDVLRCVDTPSDLRVAGVPPDEALDIAFGDSLHLAGYAGPNQLRVGEAATLAYYWSVRALSDADYFASVRFEDQDGYYAFVRDLPVWDHSHYVGGSQPTSGWSPGQVMCERYDLIVPWHMQPGRYTVRLQVFTDAMRRQEVAPIGSTSDGGGVAIGQIEVLPRSRRPVFGSR